MAIRKGPLFAACCLAAGICVGVAGAQIVATVQRSILATGAFEVSPGTTAAFFITIEGPRAASPVSVVMEIVDRTGVVVAFRETRMQAGQTAVLETPHVGVLHGRARIVESTLQILSGRRVAGSVEVKNTLTGEIRPSCTIYDPVPAGGGRN